MRVRGGFKRIRNGFHLFGTSGCVPSMSRTRNVLRNYRVSVRLCPILGTTLPSMGQRPRAAEQTRRQQSVLLRCRQRVPPGGANLVPRRCELCATGGFTTTLRSQPLSAHRVAPSMRSKGVRAQLTSSLIAGIFCA